MSETYSEMFDALEASLKTNTALPPKNEWQLYTVWGWAGRESCSITDVTKIRPIPTLRGVVLSPPFLIPPSSFVPMLHPRFEEIKDVSSKETSNGIKVQDKVRLPSRKSIKKKLRKMVRWWVQKHRKLYFKSRKKLVCFKDEMNTIFVKDVIGFHISNPDLVRFEDSLLLYLEDLSEKQLLGFGVYFVPTVVAMQESDLTPVFTDSVQISGLFCYLPQLTDLNEVKEMIVMKVIDFAEMWA